MNTQGMYRLVPLCAALLWAVPALAEQVEVQLTPYAELAFYPWHETVAEVEALRYTRISSRLEAVVETVLVEVGEQVAVGQLLSALDCRIPEAQAAAAVGRVNALQARLQRTRLRIQRLESLSRREHVSQEQLDDQRAGAQELQGSLQAERATGQALAERVQDCMVRAPFTGTIIERPVSPGHLAAPGETLYTLLDPDALEVSAGIPEQRMAGFMEAQEYGFLGAGGTATRLSLKAAPPWTDPRLRTRPVRLVAVGGAALLAGRSGRLRWQLARAHLPGHLLVRYQGRYGVYVVEGNTARFVAVEGAQEGRTFALQLQGDAQLVTTGRHGLSDGQHVVVRAAVVR